VGRRRKVVKVDRIEWRYIPIRRPRRGAQLGRGRLVAAAPARLIPVLSKNKDIKIENTDPLGSMG